MNNSFSSIVPSGVPPDTCLSVEAAVDSNQFCGCDVGAEVNTDITVGPLMGGGGINTARSRNTLLQVLLVTALPMSSLQLVFTDSCMVDGSTAGCSSAKCDAQPLL